MERLFQQHVEELKERGAISEGHVKLAERADAAAEELYYQEIDSYLKREVNIKNHIRVFKKHSLLGIQVPERYGGAGGDAYSLAIAFERIGQVGMGPLTFLDVQNCLTESTLMRWADERQKKKYLAPLAKGDKTMSFCLTEPEFGSDPSSLKTTFTEDGDGFVLNGEKYLITNGSVADTFIVFARNDKKGISAIIVDKGKGVNVEAEITEKLGLFTSDTTFLRFDGVFAPKENLLGEFGMGLSIAYTGLLSGRLGIASGCVGVIEDCLSASLSRARERVQFGKPIGRHQLVQHRLATIEENLENAKLSVEAAAYWKKKHDSDFKNLDLRRDADHRITLAKVIATNAASKAADNAVQIFGGFGYSTLAQPGRHYVDVRASRIYEGSNDVLELKLASDLLGKGFEAYR